MIEIKKKTKLLYVCLMAIALQSCQERMETEESPLQSQESQSGQIKLGEKWELPYSLRNVQAAYDSLMAENPLRSGGHEQLQATHYYVRFLPKDSAEMAELLMDTTLFLSDFPWDRDIEGDGGESYHDPSLDNTIFTWQYTRVPIDYQFTNIKYEILDEMCILPEFELTEESEEDDDETEEGDVEYVLRSSQAQSFAKQLQMASLRRAGYVSGNCTNDTIPLRSWLSNALKKLNPTWTPKATIKAWDDLLGRYIPLEGVKVYINHGGVWCYRHTDEDGHVKFPRCVGPVVYKIEWSDTYWRIFEGDCLPAYYSRSGSNRSTWNLNISGGKSLHYACIHRGARRHFYGDNCGIERPRFPYHKISYIYRDDSGDYRAAWNYLGGNAVPDIRIYGLESNKMKETDLVTKTAMHELAHASHCQSVGILTYSLCSDYIKEAWTVAVAYYMMKKEYEELRASQTHLEYIKEQYAYQRYYTKRIYSPLIVDLIDDENEMYTINGNCPNDPITGYSLKTIQKCLKGVTTVSDFKSNIKENTPRGVTDRKIDMFFKTFEDRWN
ncbi:MAG: hypothetical protein J6Y37_10535 [Paludibacteraceae bacterium]|nr:hypothetical protein [Paludibacteraceae bacterium]